MPTILIVDDSKLARIVAGKAVTALQPDWERVEAASADEAVVLFSDRRVDVVLIDYNMPGRNGVELAAELRKSHPALPIALITANEQKDVLDAAVAAGAVFVPKPLSSDTLRPFLDSVAKSLNSA